VNEEGQQPATRNELRDWVKENASLVTVTGVMLAAAVFSRNIGPGRTVVWLVSCFVFLSIILMQEMFESFPPPQHDSVKFTAFKWILGSAMANLGLYWMLIVYKASGTWMLGLASGVLAMGVGEWIVKRTKFLQDESKRGRKALGQAIVLVCTSIAILGATQGIPRLAPALERDFLGSQDTTAVRVAPAAREQPSLPGPKLRTRTDSLSSPRDSSAVGRR